MHSLYFIASILFFISTSGAFAAAAESKAPACEPFLFHQKSSPPYQWENLPASELISPERESLLVKEISELPTYGSFLDSFTPWQEELASLSKRVLRLECIHFYAKHDSDGDGIPDWQAVIDHRPSAVLYPLDNDIDGDGTENLLDPAPFDATKKGEGKTIPSHLVAHEKILQEKLWKKFGILAIDHSDQHSPAVLKNLLFLLENGPAIASRLKNFRYLYAFSGHDREVDIAAFHQVAKAISIGGAHAFAADAAVPDTTILSALAHEIGHALLMEKVTPAKLATAAHKFGRWEKALGADLYAPAFFQPHPLHAQLRKPAIRALASASDMANLVSSYATNNIHEWFAENFAASVMKSLGEKGALGKNWRGQLVVKPKTHRHHWADYNRVSGGLRNWFAKISLPSSGNFTRAR